MVAIAPVAIWRALSRRLIGNQFRKDLDHLLQLGREGALLLRVEARDIDGKRRKCAAVSRIIAMPEAEIICDQRLETAAAAPLLRQLSPPRRHLVHGKGDGLTDQRGA
ncbi:hypothetical protein GCM10007858_28020 [Bradyrhizobium liaoningense]|nr:hypothetical protein GCM10007858_28020 [Bradyrhizobium liaoningense]